VTALHSISAAAHDWQKSTSEGLTSYLNLAITLWITGPTMVDMPRQPIKKFRQFVDSLHGAQPDQFLKTPNSRIDGEREFAEFRSYLENYYSGVESVHSFMDANGSVFDCIPVGKQFSLRGKHGPIPKAPSLPKRIKGAISASPATQIVQLHPRLADQFGNRMLAPEGTIPMRRQTLEDFAQFKNLGEFFHQSSPAPKNGYASAAQTVKNVGGGSTINLWDPQIGDGQLKSLSQQWYSADTGNNEQTVEVGWQVNPHRYGNTKPVFFIFWTADCYRKTGCYNLTCNGFVQTNGNWALGGVLAPWSVKGGAQREIYFSFLLDHDKWWLFAGGETDANAVGYYPTSIFNGGALAKGASNIEFGGEVTGISTLPPMGSAVPPGASRLFQHVAYQRRIHYFPNVGTSKDANLCVTNSSPPSPKRYTAKKVVKSDAAWGETIWFGGPGGSSR
jgi:hypothetical protein